MNRALEAQARALEDYARGAEWRCLQLKSLLQPMFSLYGVDPPVLGKPLPLSYYPLDLLGAYEGSHNGVDSPGGGARQGQDEGGEGGGEGTHAACPSSPAGCLASLQARAWGQLLARCDAEMTARLQRKNRQVVDRLGRVSDYERLLVRALRDNRHRLTLPLFKPFREQQAQAQGDKEDVETPLFYCSCIVAARPATLYILYSHLVFISRLPGAWMVMVKIGTSRRRQLSTKTRTHPIQPNPIEIQPPMRRLQLPPLRGLPGRARRLALLALAAGLRQARAGHRDRGAAPAAAGPVEIAARQWHTGRAGERDDRVQLQHGAGAADRADQAAGIDPRGGRGGGRRRGPIRRRS